MEAPLPRFEVPDEERGEDESGRVFRGCEEVGVLSGREEPAGVEVQQQVQRSQTPGIGESDLTRI